MTIVDAVLAVDEIDLVNFRIKQLSQLVDHFVIGESPQTFGGRTKKLVFDELSRKGLLPPNVHIEVIDIPRDVFKGSKFDVQFYVRNELAQRAHKRFPLATVMLQDVDEIPSKEQVQNLSEETHESLLLAIPMRVFFRRANWELAIRKEKLWRPPKAFRGIPAGYNLRATPAQADVKGELGAHLSFVNMNAKRQEEKFQSYGAQEYNKPGIYSEPFLAYCDRYGLDHLGRGNREGFGLLDFVPVHELPSVCRDILIEHPEMLGEDFRGSKITRMVRAQFVRAYIQQLDWRRAGQMQPWEPDARNLHRALYQLVTTSWQRAFGRFRRKMRRAFRRARRYWA